MRKNIQLTLIITVLIGLQLLTGCTSNTPNQNNTDKIIDNNPHNQTTNLTRLAHKATNLTTIAYTLTASSSMGAYNIGNITTLYWQKPGYTKVTTTIMNYTTTLISTPNGTYIQDILTHNWTKTNEPLPKLINNYTGAMLNNTLTQVGTETIDGKPTTIVEYHTSINGTNATVRAWLWNDNGLPLKIYTTSKIMGQTITMTLRMTKISFTVQDNVFNLT